MLVQYQFLYITMKAYFPQSFHANRCQKIDSTQIVICLANETQLLLSTLLPLTNFMKLHCTFHFFAGIFGINSTNPQLIKTQELSYINY